MEQEWIAFIDQKGGSELNSTSHIELLSQVIEGLIESLIYLEGRLWHLLALLESISLLKVA